MLSERWENCRMNQGLSSGNLILCLAYVHTGVNTRKSQQSLRFILLDQKIIFILFEYGQNTRWKARRRQKLSLFILLGSWILTVAKIFICIFLNLVHWFAWRKARRWFIPLGPWMCVNHISTAHLIFCRIFNFIVMIIF